MKIDFNIIKDTSKKTKVIAFGIITVLVSLIGLTYSWVANWLIGDSSDMSLTAANLSLNYKGTSPTILAYLAPGETVEKTFEIINHNNTPVYYNLTWEAVINTFNPESDIIYTVSEKTLGEIVSARSAPSSDVNIARNLMISGGETQYLTLTLTFVLDKSRDQTNNIGNFFVGDITLGQGTQTSLDYTEVYANDVLVNSIPDTTTFKFDDKRSWCTDGTIISFDNENEIFLYDNLSSTTSCKAYFYTSKDFAYSGDYELFEVPYNGWYEIKAWGAQGGTTTTQGGVSGSYTGGKGGYTSGHINLTAGEVMYIYVGGSGITSTKTYAYNGGGQKSIATNSYTGGGATDIRCFINDNTGKCESNTSNLAWNDAVGLKSRIMVAGGGGGLAWHSTSYANGGNAGGLIGSDGNVYSSNVAGRQGKGGTQIAGGVSPGGNAGGGSFGIGGTAGLWSTYSSGGGGGGYYGGSGGAYEGNSGGGGSSYISGHTGCVAIASSSLTNEPRTPRTGTGGVSCETGTTENSCSIHYSGKTFKDTKMIDGAGYLWTYEKGIQEKMPNPSGGYYNLGEGHSGNGYARITYIPNLITHTVTLDLGGGTQSKNYNGEYYEGNEYYIENPTRYGYAFDGWNIEGVGATIKEGILTIGVSNIKLTAMWGAEYTITYDLKGTIVNNPSAFGEHFPSFTLNNPSAPGCTFLGWTGSNGTTPQTQVTIATGTTENKNYTTNWSCSIRNYGLTNAQQIFEVPINGTYNIQLWGGAGGNSILNGTRYGGNALGGYTSGNIVLNAGEILYVYVASAGANAQLYTDSAGGYNGGGLGSWDGGDNETSGAGGGSTDVRIGSNTIYDRIMVASGGGGGCAKVTGAAGGGMYGYAGNGSSGGTQTSGYAFFQGQSGSGTGGDNDGVGGAGGGYWGGTTNLSIVVGTGSGGSSYISGHSGCIAITGRNSTSPKCTAGSISEQCSIHYSTRVFTNSVMIDGNSKIWSEGTYASGGAVTYPGNPGGTNGYARVTYLGS